MLRAPSPSNRRALNAPQTPYLGVLRWVLQVRGLFLETRRKYWGNVHRRYFTLTGELDGEHSSLFFATTRASQPISDQQKEN